MLPLIYTKNQLNALIERENFAKYDGMQSAYCALGSSILITFAIVFEIHSNYLFTTKNTTKKHLVLMLDHIKAEGILKTTYYARIFIQLSSYLDRELEIDFFQKKKTILIC